MTLRQKLLLMFSLTVVGVVAAVGWTVSARVRRVFENINQEQTTALVSQFQRAFDERAAETAATVEHVAQSDQLHRTSLEIGSGRDASQYLTIAGTLAQDFHLDYLELVGHDGSIISSAQWPARFGYMERDISAAGKPAFLNDENLPDGTSQVGLFAARVVPGSSPPLYVVGGRQLNADFLKDFPQTPNTRAYLYRNLGTDFDPVNFAGALQNETAPYKTLVNQALSAAHNASGVVYITSRREDSVDATAIPLKGSDGAVLAVLVVANSRRGMVEVQRHIRDIAFGVAGIGILFAIAASLWIAARVSKPIEQLARAASQVAAGDWNTRVDIRARDEIGVLAKSFNNMTHELTEQRDRLVQSERVAAWRELARRLAHELKNPLFPLQITVENLVRAHRLPRVQFDEVFLEGTATLQAEINNLRAIVSRFSDFSKMPEPQLEKMDLREAVQRVIALHAPALEQKHISIGTSISPEPLRILGDPELLHRALSNLVLNAMDAMPEGGTLTVSASRSADFARIAVADSGPGLSDEECSRLFTPYFTTRQHGTGLGLAIVRDVAEIYGGSIHLEESEDLGGLLARLTLPAG